MAPAASIRDLLAFCATCPATDLDASMRERILTRLASGPRCIVDLHESGGRVLVAAAIDTFAEPGDVVVVGILGERGVSDWARAAAAILDTAEDAARRSGRPVVEVIAPAPLAPAFQAELVARSYAIDHHQFSMERAAVSAPADTPPPTGWRWQEVDESLIGVLRRLMAEAFVEFPIYFPSDELFAKRALETRLRPLLLMDEGNDAAGFVRVDHDAGDPRGTIGQIGRHPRHRGRGLGPVLMSKSLSILVADGASHLELSVVARNQRALSLYRFFGFEIARQTEIFRGRVGQVGQRG